MDTEMVKELVQRHAKREAELDQDIKEITDRVIDATKGGGFSAHQAYRMMNAATETKRQERADLDTFERVLMSLL